MNSWLAWCVMVVCVSGCAAQRKTVLHPISDVDIFVVEAGAVCGSHTSTKAGYFVSKEYLSDVLDATVR